MPTESENREEREEQRVEASNERKREVSKASQIVGFITGLLAAVLMLRVVLALMGANLENQFADFIYSVTDPFVAPFRGLLQVGEFNAGVSRFELETVIAAFIYILIGWGIMSAIRLAK
ncbi:hypothetical protein A3F37_02440 [Candidatus Saccharibacteria bacterium RIFCSPHIGHO2_12_FULL_41_12]|nr:MAG: hypothetical protein A3F37_02440 [Candidatus Saccharibacteria bacterium RIFCSPHIGHO2_12_FULL_41_12]